VSRLAAALVVVAACGGDNAGHATDAAIDVVDGQPDANECASPALDQPWLASYLHTTMATLASAPRFSTTERADARTFLAGELTAAGWTAQRHAFASGENVYATIPATVGTPGDEIIVGAHFDTVMSSPGANDDGSGTVVVLALAKYLAAMPCRTAPVTLVLFDLEEAGLIGSNAFSQTRDPASVRAVHTIDQVSWDSDGDMRFEVEQPTVQLEAEWVAAAAIVGVPTLSTLSGGTDHVAFRDRGFAAVGLSEEYVGGDTSPHRHQPTDTPATVDEPYLQLAAKLTAQVVLAEVAP
jgi:Zn-dependent M28 family amino/carboxypeptidase